MLFQQINDPVGSPRSRILQNPQSPASKSADALGDAVTRRVCPKFLDVCRATLSEFFNGNAALSAEMVLRIKKGFGVKMETLLDMQAWHDAYTMFQRAGEIAVEHYQPTIPEPR